MNDEKKNVLAAQTYQTAIHALEKRGWRFDRRDEKLILYFKVSGDDIPMDMILHVDAGRQVVRLSSPLPFKMSEQKRIEGAVAACAASYGLADGYFEYDIGDGMIVYKVTTAFVDSVIGEAAIHYLVECACALADHYNDLFLALDKGMIDLGTFIARCK